MSNEDMIFINIYKNFEQLNRLDKQALLTTLIQIMIKYDGLDFKDYIKSIQLSNKLLGFPYEL